MSKKSTSFLLQSLFAIVLFIITIGSRVPLVDRFYEATFQPDSRPCIEETRSFYFFFKSPSKATLPHNLDYSPTYSDGSFITTALVANLVRVACKHHIIKEKLSDSHYSLFIYTTRWLGVCFDGLSVVVLYFILLLLSGSSFASFFVCLVYYIFNAQVLNVNLMRVDHFGLLVANLALLVSLYLFHQPQKLRYYIFSGIVAGLVSSTKLNFPFYLIILALVLLVLVYDKKIVWSYFAVFIVCFLLTSSFMYMRWLIYPEQIIERVSKIFEIGEQWVLLMGLGNIFYYIWEVFFPYGKSIELATLLFSIYLIVLVYLLVKCFKGDRLSIILLVTFLLQSIIFMFSPKISRYGLIMPGWIAILFLTFVSSLRPSYIKYVALAFILLPFKYNFQGYLKLKTDANKRDISIKETRIAAYNWFAKNVKTGSNIIYKSPFTSNPPIFDLPYNFASKILDYPFLDKERCAVFLPPSMNELKGSANFLITSDLQTNDHLATLSRYHLKNNTLERWQLFYDSLAMVFKQYTFESTFENYHIKKICVYEINDSLKPSHLVLLSKLQSKRYKTQTAFSWEASQTEKRWRLEYEVQIAEDSSMQWLLLGSQDGFLSKYRLNNVHSFSNMPSISFVPKRIRTAFDQDVFVALLDGNSAKVKAAEIEVFFEEILTRMHDQKITFKESVYNILPYEKAYSFLNEVDGLYSDCGGVINSDFLSFTQKVNLQIDTKIFQHGADFSEMACYICPLKLDEDKPYYWRVRAKNKEDVISEWSQVMRVYQ